MNNYSELTVVDPGISIIGGTNFENFSFRLGEGVISVLRIWKNLHPFIDMPSYHITTNTKLSAEFANKNVILICCDLLFRWDKMAEGGIHGKQANSHGDVPGLQNDVRNLSIHTGDIPKGKTCLLLLLFWESFLCFAIVYLQQECSRSIVTLHSSKKKKETPRLFNLNFKKSGSNFFWSV